MSSPAGRVFGRYWFGATGPSGYGFHATAEQVAADHADAVRGRVALVTGAASGIGFETARALAAHGATVFVAARNQEKAQHTVDALLKLLPDAQLRPFAVDLSSLKDIQRAANAFIATGSPLHLLINNAGAPAPSATRRPA